MANADFEGRRPAGGGGWWDWKPVQHALHHLWMTGTFAIHSRRHFQKHYDLLERALPDAHACEPVSREEFQRWHVERSLHGMGAATELDLAWYLTFPRHQGTARRAALRSMLERGEITEIEVEGSSARWLALTRDLPALATAGRRHAPSRGTTLLAPFDSLLWYRNRVTRLFGFDYRIEVYTPGPKRVHGYYTLPILHDGRLIGRVDAKAHRVERKLEIRHVHLEPWFAVDVTDLQLPLDAMGFGVDPADQAAVVEDRQRVVAVHALGAGRVDLDAVVEAEQACHAVAIPQQRVE